MVFNMRSILENVQNGQFAGIDIKTIPTIRKTVDVFDDKGKKTRVPNLFYGNVEKLVTGSRVFIGASYEKMIERRMKELNIPVENFEAGTLPWGSYVDGGFPVIKHNGKFYLRVIFESSGKTEYFFEGRKTNLDEIIGLSVPKVTDNSQGGINNKVIVRTIDFNNIVKIRCAGQEFKGPFCWK